tara:strand:+ start:635 stop:2026 length:1392 start_codon:yes stop_codon:yes gene_type:complete
MASEWQRYLFEDCMDAIIDYRGKTPKKTNAGIPLITAKIIKNGAIQPVKEFIAEGDYDAWMRRGIPEPGDVVLTTEAPLGEVAQLDSRKIALAQRVITLRGKKDFLDNTFLKYLLLSSDVQHQLDGRGTGTTVKGIKQSELRKLELPIPDYNTQKYIAHVIGSLDNKIQLNQQTNETLEKMAQALFKSWFVDFDPVIDNALEAGNTIPDKLKDRAKRRQQQLAKPDHQPLPDDIRQLFPDDFELTDELGWVPMGWEVKPLGASFELLGGHPFKSSSYLDDGNYGVVTIRNVQDGFFVQECANRTSDIPEKMKAHCSLSKGDVLLSLTGNVGRVCIVSEGDYLLNQRVAKILGKDAIPKSVAYFFFRQELLYKQMITIAKGTAQQNLSPIETIKIMCVLPSNFVLAKLSSPFEALFEKMTENTVQSQTLTSLRDTLLPKLISGELRLPSDALSDAEQQPAAATS